VQQKLLRLAWWEVCKGCPVFRVWPPCDGVYINSLRTNPEVLLQLVRENCGLEREYWIRETQLLEDDHRYFINLPK
jgi:hypothetical protein